jgi:hypothetical protein
MFGQSKPVVFESYGSRRSRKRPPRWLVLGLVCIGLGAAGVVFVQERYLPPRLSADETAKLRGAYEQADGQRQRLTGELAGTSKRLEVAQREQDRLNAELVASRATIERQRDDAVSLVSMLPPGPQGGSVVVRAGQFAAKDGALNYTVVLTSDRARGKPIAGTMKLVVSGLSARGVDSEVTAAPATVSVDRQALVRGSLPLPAGFRPRDTTILVQDHASGRLLGKRVMLAQ